MPGFVNSIFKFVDDDVPLSFGNQQDNPQDEQMKDQEEERTLIRLAESRKLIKQLKFLFAQMTIGDKKYADPSMVLKSITDDSGRPMEIGEEKDIGEFNDSFLSRI